MILACTLRIFDGNVKAHVRRHDDDQPRHKPRSEVQSQVTKSSLSNAGANLTQTAGKHYGKVVVLKLKNQEDIEYIHVEDYKNI